MEIKWKILTYGVWIQMEIFWQPYTIKAEVCNFYNFLCLLKLCCNIMI